MFDLERDAGEARRFDRLGNIYHRGQSLAWNGRDVLQSLVEKHGKPKLEGTKREAFRQVFGPILWGELAAWKISAQLADRLEPLEAKLAATSQAHDEARHFYVMYDYMTLATGAVPKSVHAAGEKLLSCVMSTDDLACKLLGMQLQLETSALSIFQGAREQNICPVLTELLGYFEKDEARHVGLGVQYLPLLMRRMGRLEGARLTAFGLQVSFWLIASNQAMTPALRELGLDPRRVLRLGKSKQLLVFEELWGAVGKTGVDAGDVVARLLEGVANAMWPPEGQRTVPGRVRAFAAGLRSGIDEVSTTIQPEVETPMAGRGN